MGWMIALRLVIARLLDHHPRACWTGLVGWAVTGRMSRDAWQGRECAQDCPGCYCGKHYRGANHD